jgi:hypothetical protein
MCTARRVDFARISHLRSERLRASALLDSSIENQDGDESERDRVSTARSRLAEAQKFGGGGGIADEYGTGRGSKGRTPRPQTAGSYRSTGRESARPEWDGDEDDGGAGRYFEMARETGRSKGGSARPKSAGAGRSGRSEYSNSARSQRQDSSRSEKGYMKVRPKSAGGVNYSNLGMMRTSTLKKLALTQPKVAAAARAARAEKFLDQRQEQIKTIKIKKARPTSAPAARSKARKVPQQPQHSKPSIPPNPAEVGIPEGGNWKSVGAYNYNDMAASQLPAPWATHYHVFEKFPSPKVSARSKKTQELQDKMTMIQSQLREVEEELEARKKEREEVGRSYNNTRKANGLPQRRKGGGNYGKVRGNKGRTGKGRTGTGRKQGGKGGGGGGKGGITVSGSARDYINRM